MSYAARQRRISLANTGRRFSGPSRIQLRTLATSILTPPARSKGFLRTSLIWLGHSDIPEETIWWPEFDPSFLSFQSPSCASARVRPDPMPYPLRMKSWNSHSYRQHCNPKRIYPVESHDEMFLNFRWSLLWWTLDLFADIDVGLSAQIYPTPQGRKIWSDWDWVITSLGFTFNVASLIRFPYLCARHGGGEGY